MSNLVILALAVILVKPVSAFVQSKKEVCYPELGCFGNDYPWSSALRPLPPPLGPKEINVRLYCYTRDSTKRYSVTVWPKISMGGCPFKETITTVFITHGFASNGNTSWASAMKDNYFIQVNATIFIVDWGFGAQKANYLQVASNTRVVGAVLVRFLNYLRNKRGLSPDKLHLIGHSLGAHISSYAAKGTPGVGRITALDPAQPGFEGFDQKVRLDKSDARFLEVVHTNAAPLIPFLGFGMIRSLGHVDFYMNGGASQPGCVLPDVSSIKSIGDLVNITVETLSNLVSCSHGRAHQYYIQVLKKNCVIWGRKASLTSTVSLVLPVPLFSSLNKCHSESCIPLVLDTPSYRARGSFVTTTTAKPPYCETDPEKNKRLFAAIKENINNNKNPFFVVFSFTRRFLNDIKYRFKRILSRLHTIFIRKRV